MKTAAAFTLAVLWPACLGIAGEGGPIQARVFRTFMPGAGPSAFGVVLRPGLALCYDSLRGGVNQVWRGTLDLAPTLRAKINQPAAIHGRVFYTESIMQPLRINNSGKVPERRFKGYRYADAAVTFEYTLDGVAISETLRAADDAIGLERRWKATAGTTLFFLAEAQTDSEVTFSGGAEIAPGVWRHVAADAVAFIMQIKPRTP